MVSPSDSRKATREGPLPSPSLQLWGESRIKRNKSGSPKREVGTGFWLGSRPLFPPVLPSRCGFGGAAIPRGSQASSISCPEGCSLSPPLCTPPPPGP